jgi:hypothetical protein
MPYVKQSSGQQDGAIITFNDITRSKHVQEELDHSNKSLKRLMLTWIILSMLLLMIY